MVKCFIEGDQICIVADNFINLAESDAVFVPICTELGAELFLEVTRNERSKNIKGGD